jgi:hypothetical protein
MGSIDSLPVLSVDSILKGSDSLSAPDLDQEATVESLTVAAAGRRPDGKKDKGNRSKALVNLLGYCKLRRDTNKDKRGEKLSQD